MPNQTIEKVRRSPNGTFKQIYPGHILGLLPPTQKLDVASVSKHLGMSRGTAYRRLRALGLYPKPPRIIPEEELETLYVKEEKSLAELARLFSCDSSLIRNRLQHFGIPIRSHTKAMSLAAQQNKLGVRGHKQSNGRVG